MKEQMQKIWKKYEEAGMPTPATSRSVAAWAVNNGLWKPRSSDIVSQCSDDLSKALRDEYKTDRLGRKYRTKHAVRITKNGKQLTIWADIDKAPRQHMANAFAQRRKQIVGDCHQLKVDMDYYNNANSNIEPIQIVFDFRDDVDEIARVELGLEYLAS